MMDSKSFYRLKVTEVIKNAYTGELRLKVAPQFTYHIIINGVLMNGFWNECCVKVNDTVNVIDSIYDEKTQTLIVNNDSGIVVLNGDNLISITTLMSANFCMRKSWLSERFRGSSFGNRVMLIGDVIHQLFQKACKERLKGIESLRNAVTVMINDIHVLHYCYSIGITRDQLTEEIMQYLPHIANWMDIYVHCDRKIQNKINNDQNCDLKVIEVRDIEENVWNTQLGLKGKVDVTLEVAIHNNRRKIMPLELKTGRASFSNEHEGQTTLYSIMMNDQFNTNEGLLLYLKDGPQMRKITVKPSVKRDLIHLRNKLSGYLSDYSNGPEPKNNYNLCSKCDHLLDCTLTLKTLEPNNLALSEVMSNELVPKVLNNLSFDHLEFFKNWMSLLHLEAAFINEREKSSNNIFWNEPSEKRENESFGFAKMILKSHENDNTYIFVRSSDYNNLGQLNFNESRVKIWSRIALSVDNYNNSGIASRVAIAIGFVKRINTEEIEINFEYPIHQSYHSCIFRIDHLSYNNFFSINFTNLLHLMDPFSERSEILRRIIIDRKPVIYSNKLTKKIVTRGKHILKPLNLIRQKAVLKALSTDSYVLLKSNCDDTKMETIVALIRLLIELNQTVLITSFTHSAADNVLIKLKSYGIDFLRIGSLSRIHNEICDYSCDKRTAMFSTTEDLQTFYSNVKVIGCTYASVGNHPIFEHRTFDYCIIDESSQILLPSCVGPLFYANRFMLIGGDLKKSRPNVQCDSVKVMEIDINLFSHMHDHHNTIDLTIENACNSDLNHHINA